MFQSREGMGHEVLSLVQGGGSCNFQLPLGGGSPYFQLTTNETVDYTCYMKHSQLQFIIAKILTNLLCGKKKG